MMMSKALQVFRDMQKFCNPFQKLPLSPLFWTFLLSNSGCFTLSQMASFWGKRPLPFQYVDKSPVIWNLTMWIECVSLNYNFCLNIISELFRSWTVLLSVFVQLPARCGPALQLELLSTEVTTAATATTLEVSHNVWIRVHLCLLYHLIPLLAVILKLCLLSH